MTVNGCRKNTVTDQVLFLFQGKQRPGRRGGGAGGGGGVGAEHEGVRGDVGWLEVDHRWLADSSPMGTEALYVVRAWVYSTGDTKTLCTPEVTAMEANQVHGKDYHTIKYNSIYLL